MGRDWLYKIRLDWYAIKSLQVSQATPLAKERLQTMLDKYSDAFEDELGTFTSAKAKLTLREDSQAHFCKARAVPYALRPKVEEELRRLQKEGILTKVEWSEWGTPIVPVPKKDGSVRICGDYKITVNPELQAEQYPLPRIGDICANLAGGQKFSKIDEGIPPTRDGRRFQEMPHYQHSDGPVSVQQISVRHHICTCYLAAYH